MEDDSIDSFAAELAQADMQSEQPSTGSESDLAGGDAQADTGDAPDAGQADAAQGEQEGQPEQSPEDSGEGGKTDPVHKWVTASGEAFEVSESELRDGYLRTQDYTRKTQELAEQTKHAQTQIQQHAQQQTQVLAQMQQGLMYLGGLDAQIQALAAQNLPTADLRIQRMQAEQQLGAALAQFQNGMAQTARAHEQQAVSAAEQRIAQRFQGITAQDVSGLFATLHKVAKPTEAEVALIRQNPALAEMALYAGKWLDLQAKRPEVTNKVRKLPPTTTAPRAAAPTTKADVAIKALNSKRTFSAAEFASLLKTTR